MSSPLILIINPDKPVHYSVSSITQEHLAKVRKIAPTATVVLAKTAADIRTHEKNAHIILTPDIDLINLQKTKELEWVHLSTAGASHASHLLRDTEIILTNSSGVHPVPIAEHVFGYLLMFARKLHTSYYQQMTKKAWFDEPSDIFELNRKTIAIIGFGKIGDGIAKLAKSFRMHVLAVSRSHRYQPDIDSWYPSDKLPDVLAQADIVVNCLPHTEKTEQIFNKEMFGAFKKGAMFINIGRGKTVDEKELIAALKSGKISAAGLDVFAKEPLPKTSPLWNMEQVIITPHYAGHTPFYADRMIDIFCANVRAFLGTRSMETLVDKSRGY